jgi:type VI secretion system Hcp family effector
MPIIIMIALFAAVLSFPSFGYTMEAFLMVPNVKGESVDQKYAGWIAGIQSFNWGHQIVGSTTLGGSGAGRVQFSPLAIVKMVDGASVKLAQMTATGLRMPEVILEIRSNPQVDAFLKVRLIDVSVINYKVDVPPGQPITNMARPLETVVFQFNKIEWITRTMDGKGIPGPEIKGGYDLSALKAF